MKRIEVLGNDRYLVYTSGFGELSDEFAAGMLENNRIPGLLSYNLEFRDNIYSYKFKLRGRTLAEQFSEIVTPDFAGAALRAVVYTLKVAESYMLDLEQCVISAEYITYDGEHDTAYVALVPTTRPQCVSFKTALRDILKTAPYALSGNAAFIEQVFSLLDGDSDVSAAALYDLLVPTEVAPLAADVAPAAVVPAAVVPAAVVPAAVVPAAKEPLPDFLLETDHSDFEPVPAREAEAMLTPAVGVISAAVEAIPPAVEAIPTAVAAIPTAVTAIPPAVTAIPTPAVTVTPATAQTDNSPKPAATSVNLLPETSERIPLPPPPPPLPLTPMAQSVTQTNLPDTATAKPAIMTRTPPQSRRSAIQNVAPTPESAIFNPEVTVQLSELDESLIMPAPVEELRAKLNVPPKTKTAYEPPLPPTPEKKKGLFGGIFKGGSGHKQPEAPPPPKPHSNVFASAAYGGEDEATSFFDNKATFPHLESLIPGGDIVIAVTPITVGNGKTVGKFNLRSGVVIHNPMVSRLHATITREGDRYYITDTHSRNHTLKNGTKLEADVPSELKDGDKLTFADSDFIFRA
ncbi:hypothetical protein FACS1894133_2040 [Clostridia bacterium]|nr:hypothetical protein FACS1894133_2040 [Clostridia bacterium]